MSPLRYPQFEKGEEKGEDDYQEEVESEPLLEVDTQDTQSKEGSQDDSEAAIQEKPSVVPQFEKGINHISQQVPPPDIEPPSQKYQASNPTHISVEPTNKVNQIWYVKGLWFLYERESF